MAKGNHQATGKKSKHGPELVQRIRGAVLSAFDAVEKEGKLLSEILAEKFKEDPFRFMDMVSKFCPREVAMELEASISHSSEMSEDDLEHIAAGSSARAAAKAKKPAQSPGVH